MYDVKDLYLAEISNIYSEEEPYFMVLTKIDKNNYKDVICDKIYPTLEAYEKNKVSDEYYKFVSAARSLKEELGDLKVSAFDQEQLLELTLQFNVVYSAERALENYFTHLQENRDRQLGKRRIN